MHGASTPIASTGQSNLRSRRSTGRIGKPRRPISTRRNSGVRARFMHHPLSLTVDRAALQANGRWLQDRAGVPAGAAIKADGYGLGARETMVALHEAGCRDFFVSTWAEADDLELPSDSGLLVLHGLGPGDIASALASDARPCLNTPGQVARWKEIAPNRLCDVMIDTGMNRL